MASSVWQGVHGRRRAGLGETFWQFRNYESGDSISRIDWRQSAKGDKVFIREREWEAAQTAFIWADQSGSMQYASTPSLPTKAERANVLMLALAGLLLRGGEKISWMDTHNSITAYGNKGLEQLAGQITEQKNAASLPPDLPFVRNAHMVLCGDFLTDMDNLTRVLHNASQRPMKGALVHILDPIEESFALNGRVEMMGLEGEASLLIPNAENLRTAYAEKMAAHKARLQQLAKSAGWFYVRHVTDTPPEITLMEIYQALSGE